MVGPPPRGLSSGRVTGIEESEQKWARSLEARTQNGHILVAEASSKSSPDLGAGGTDIFSWAMLQSRAAENTGGGVKKCSIAVFTVTSHTTDAEL